MTILIELKEKLYSEMNFFDYLDNKYNYMVKKWGVDHEGTMRTKEALEESRIELAARQARLDAWIEGSKPVAGKAKEEEVIETNKESNEMRTYYSQSHLVAASQTKDITLPFNGLCNSYLGELLDVEIESISDELSEQGAEDLSDFIYSLDLKKYHKALTDGYASFLIDSINNYNGLKIEVSDVDYVPINGQNRGDKLIACVNVNTLPQIPLSELQPYATDSLTSRSGFSSYYDPDLQAFQGVRLENWSDVYITFIIEYLANDCLSNDISDIEQAYIDALQCTGGAIELLMANISNADCDKLNKLLKGDQ